MSVRTLLPLVLLVGACAFKVDGVGVGAEDAPPATNPPDPTTSTAGPPDPTAPADPAVTPDAGTPAPPAPSAIGQHCGGPGAGDCPAGYVCFRKDDKGPDGYCTVACSGGVTCPLPGMVCVGQDEAQKKCALPCGPGGACAKGFLCCAQSPPNACVPDNLCD